MEEPYKKEDNREAWTAWQCLSRTGINVFLTGRAGTGKTTFLKRLKERSPKRMVVVAPTGVAAINAGGVTIHSFFQLPFTPYVPGTLPKQDFKIRKEKLYIIRSMDLLVIDEISMVRADLLDSIDAQLRLLRHNQRPFGGVQLLMIGDLQQLAPVVQDSEAAVLTQYYSTSYFFGSHALKRTQYLTIELQKVYRQSDPAFVSLLNKVRDNMMDAQSLQTLNSRYKPNFQPADGKRYVRLTTHNSAADSVNRENLARLKGYEKTYECQVVDKFPEALYPAEAQLTLKVGAQVMFIKNDKQADKRFFNGKIGVVAELKNTTVVVNCGDEDNIEIGADEWQNVSYDVDKETNEIVEKVEGVFRQIPLRLAWAITIHKSQGLTFDHAIIDAANSFSHGQVYVALSRCRTFEGMVLSSQIPPSAIIPDAQIADFISQQSSNAVTDAAIERFAVEYSYDMLDDVFDFEMLTVPAFRLMNLLQQHYAKTYPKLIASMGARLAVSQNEIEAVGRKFLDLCKVKKAQGVNPQGDPQFSERIVNGAKYFLQKMSSSLDLIVAEGNISLDNQAVNKQYRSVLDHLREELRVKRVVLNAIGKEGFSTRVVVNAKAQALSPDFGKQSPKAVSPDSQSASGVEDIRNKDLFEKLDAWRQQEASRAKKPANAVFSTKTLMAISNAMPDTADELLNISGVGKVKVKAFGGKVLPIIASYKKSLGLPVLTSATGSVFDGEEDSKTEKKEEKAHKENTCEVSLRLFGQLKDVEAVAKERGLKASTIRGHLFAAVAAGLLPVDDILPRDRHERLRTLLEKADPDDVEYVKALVAMGFDYSEIRYVNAEIESANTD